MANTSAAWAPDASGNWSVNANWNPANYPSGAGNTASFLRAITGAKTVTLDIPITIGNIISSDGGGAGDPWSFSGAQTITLNNNALVPSLDIRNTAYFNVPVASSLGFTKIGSGQLYFSSNISAIGGTVTVSAGGIVLQPVLASGGSITAFATGTNIVLSGGSASLVSQPFDNTGTPVTVSQTINGNFSGGGALYHDGSLGDTAHTTVLGSVAGLSLIRAYKLGSITVPDLLTSGTFFSLNQTGETTTFNINAASSVSGTTELRMWSDGGASTHVFRSIGAGTVTTSGPITRPETAGNSWTATLVFGGAGGTFTIGGNATNSTTSGLINLTKQEGGTVILSGDNSAFRNNTVTISGGTLRAGTATAFGASAGGAVTMGANTTIELINGITFTKAINQASGTIRSVSGANIVNSTMTMTGAVTFEASSGALLALASGGAIAGNMAVILAGDGDISIERQFSAATTLTKNDSGTATLTNTSNAFTGAVTHNAGVLAISSNGALGAGSSVSLSGSAILRYTGTLGATLARSVSGSGLSGAGFENTAAGSLAVTAGTLSGTIKLGSSNSSAQYNTLGATISSGGFTKEGDGRWIVTTSNDLAGATTVTTGTLMGANADGATKRLLGGEVTIAAGAKIQLGSDNDQKGRNRYGSLIINGTSVSKSRIRIGGSAVNPTVQMSGNLTISGPVTWRLTADTFKTPGTYRLIEFVSGALVGNITDVTVQVPTGRSVPSGGLVYDGAASPKTITVTVN